MQRGGVGLLVTQVHNIRVWQREEGVRKSPNLCDINYEQPLRPQNTLLWGGWGSDRWPPGWPLHCGRRWWRNLWLTPKLPDVSSPQNEGSLPEAWTLCKLWCCRCSWVCPCSDPCYPVRGCCWARCPCNTQSGNCPRTGWEGCRRSGLPTASQCRGHPVGKKLGSDPGK